MAQWRQRSGQAQRYYGTTTFMRAPQGRVGVAAQRTLRRMATRAFTGFGAGRSAEEALASAEVPPSLSRVGEVVVPTGENPSKVGTFVQRVALDPTALAEVPATLRSTVEVAAAQLAESPDLALAVSMAGTPAGDKMLARLAPSDGQAVAWLLFGLVQVEGS